MSAARRGWGGLRGGWLAVVVMSEVVAACTLLGPGPQVPIAPPPAVPGVVLDATRGQLLYQAHCVSCHTTQAHWRNNSIVGAWSDVLVQVNRWQGNTGQHWSEQEIGDVAAYLNAVYYRMSCAPPGCLGKSDAALEAAPTLARD